MTKILHLDFETYSEADIRKVGLENYIRDPAFCVTVVAWAFDDGRVQSIPWPVTVLPEPIREHVYAGGEIRAWNAGFEHAILNDHYGLDVGVEQMTCTMQKALAYGLPAGLLKAGRALGLSVLKDESKRLLMLSMGRPRKGNAPWHVSAPQKLLELEAYCRDDVAAERAIDKVVPDLHPWEKKLSELDHRINRKGVRIDRDAVKTLRMAAAYAMHGIDSECATLTGGWVTKPGSQVQKLMDWLQHHHTWLMNLSKEEVASAIEAAPYDYQTGQGWSCPPPPVVKRVLELRQMAARSSVSKLERMEDVASTADSRARHLLQFYGAGRTGRWAGRLIQPQNLPRSMGMDAEQLIAAANQDLEAPRLLWGDTMAAISRSLRSCFIAREKHVLVAVDLSQIEARVLAWMAGQADVLDTFRRGEDVYMLAAAKVGSMDRQLGKVLTLACGFGMGWMKFQTTAAAAPYYVTLTAQEAQHHLKTWRLANASITGLWDEVERGVRAAVNHKGYVFYLPHGMAVKTWGDVTQIKKPNGVKLTYHNMRFWDGDLLFDGVNSTTKNWGREKAYGGRLVENLVQSVARDVMAEAMLASPEVPVMTVHDEIVWEVPQIRPAGDHKHYLPVAPSWAADLPVAAEVHVGFRYAK